MKRKRMETVKNYFTKGEMMLWGTSVVTILLSFYMFDRQNSLTLLASLIGVTSLIFNAKGNPFGQFLMIVFSVLYGMISYTFSYYGEMATYLGMTAPMALVALISWIRNPYQGNKSEVKVNQLSKTEHFVMWVLAVIVTGIFYVILEYFDTANIVPSTISVTTSFVAVYLTFRRSPYYAIGYAANDIVLIVLWTLAAMENRAYLSVSICFVAFFVNDLYGYFSWKKMESRQREALLA